MVEVYKLTPAAAAQAFQDNGLDALGLTAVRLSPRWGSATPTFDSATLRLVPSGSVLAPYRGTLEYLDRGAEFRDVNGAPITGPVAAFRLHPQAVARLERLMAARYAPLPGEPHHRLVPETLVFIGASDNRAPQTYEPGELLPFAHPMSFHDNRGLIIDPIAIAAIFADLISAFPALALDFSSGTGPDGAGGVATIAGLASGVLVQVTDLHGRPYAAVPNGPGVEKRAGANATGVPDASGLVVLSSSETLAGAGPNAAERLRLGWATGGVMNAGPLAQPNLKSGVTLPRQFLRAFAVDLDWHLRGNRTQSAVRGVPGEDGDMPEDLKPQVRDGVTIGYTIDGPDFLASAGEVLERIMGDVDGKFFFVVSPIIEDGVGVPPAPGDAAHWPAFPAPNTGAEFSSDALSPLVGATATWTEGHDVVLELPADTVPDGASVRVYPQSFQLIESIGEAPSFLRGDGGAAIARAGEPTRVLVHNPLNLAEGDPLPSPAALVFDLVVTPRKGKRRLYAGRCLAIAPGPAPKPDDPFGPKYTGEAGETPTADQVDLVANLDPACLSIAPAPLFGMKRTVDPPDGLSDPIDIVRALGSEEAPRQGPRHPTMGRLETVIVTGLKDESALSDGLSWEAVVSGARWSRETRSARHRDGNPGNPPGPDTHSAGVRVNGALAYDLACHAARRAQSMLPLTEGNLLAWLPLLAAGTLNPPQPGPTPPPAGTSSGVLLETVAAIAETPELSLLPDTTPLASDTPLSFDQVIEEITDALGIPPSSVSIDVTNEDLVINEVRREYFRSKHGVRDALWSLARALSEAEELVYIETPGFARTARPSGSPAAHEIDLVQILADRLAAQPNLKVVICTPREPDLVPAPFARRAIAQRKEACEMLAAAGQGRVVAFHPRGFPGRFVGIRSTCVIVDDVWSLTGATHFRRRGMTFDGSVAIASFDREIVDGYSRKVRAQRQLLMAAKLGITELDEDGLPVPEFMRLARPASAFKLIADLLAQGGLGRISPLWHGPTDTTVLPQSDDIADPDGSNGAPAGLTLAAFLSEA